MSIQTKSHPSVHNQFAFQGISKKQEHTRKDLTVLEIMENCDWMVLKVKRTFDFAEAKTYSVMEFSLSGKSVHLAGLFKGMISLGAPKEISLTYQKEIGSYIFKYYESDDKVAVKYFNNIISIIEGEIRFKSILKKVIVNLQAFESSQQFLKNELSN